MKHRTIDKERNSTISHTLAIRIWIFCSDSGSDYIGFIGFVMEYKFCSSSDFIVLSGLLLNIKIFGLQKKLSNKT